MKASLVQAVNQTRPKPKAIHMSSSPLASGIAAKSRVKERVSSYYPCSSHPVFQTPQRGEGQSFPRMAYLLQVTDTLARAATRCSRPCRLDPLLQGGHEHWTTDVSRILSRVPAVGD
jgi:hypothetical protein